MLYAMTKHAVVLVVLAIGCASGSKAGGGGGGTAVGNEGDTGQSTSAATDDVTLVALIAGAGPIGDGNCTQRSYQITVGKVELGVLPEPPPAWVHFEACGDERTAITFSGSGLDIGATYRLRLRRGASSNFPGDYMIVDATGVTSGY